ncbi:uncharacterized protein SAMN05421878_102112 [Actinobaculum suis]|uniref:HD domain-containing protein n=1 Tax=Actinobaculum suis TaxID=1657 RepID=A0A0K9ETM2_9ACTO|nr:HD domain-containing protein [Actinobaculum suis]KMY23201.1 hypothetical protein ACU19_05505 [Actinobaculum suis]MDY5152659.1 HD domain-containing protein [Actinobaculum suis]SDE10788.1 uncharacterized protein SAMN05421878_102112 [Actinobaculum suis]
MSTNPYLAPSLVFLRSHLKNADVSKPAQRYRYFHCLRVAAIGRAVAENEGLDPDKLEIACLLHDIGKFDSTRPVDHGREGAKIVRPFLQSLGMAAADVEEICQGIAMHTDGRWNYPADSPDYENGVVDYPQEPSVLARSVGDCDNIDRYSVYRIYDTLNYHNFAQLRLPAQLDFVERYRRRIARERNYQCATRSAQRLWIESLERQEHFFAQLAMQVGSALPYEHIRKAEKKKLGHKKHK